MYIYIMFSTLNKLKLSALTNVFLLAKYSEKKNNTNQAKAYNFLALYKWKYNRQTI